MLGSPNTSNKSTPATLVSYASGPLLSSTDGAGTNMHDLVVALSGSRTRGPARILGL